MCPAFGRLQGLSRCIVLSPGLGLASAERAARNKERRGKLWKGFVLALTRAHRKEKLEQQRTATY